MHAGASPDSTAGSILPVHVPADTRRNYIYALFGRVCAGASPDSTAGSTLERESLRRKQLEEALLVQMDMQRKLHEQLEVRAAA